MTTWPRLAPSDSALALTANIQTPTPNMILLIFTIYFTRLSFILAHNPQPQPQP